jgi:hypothetical protein
VTIAALPLALRRGLVAPLTYGARLRGRRLMATSARIAAHRRQQARRAARRPVDHVALDCVLVLGPACPQATLGTQIRVSTANERKAYLFMTR